MFLCGSFLSSALVGYLRVNCSYIRPFFMARYALVVGIGDYQHLKLLSKPASDAQTVCDLLRDRGNFNEIHTLLDAEATYAALSDRLEYVLLKQGDRSEVLLYFTGHGFTAGPSKWALQGHLATYDCKVTLDGNSVTYAERALSFQELNALIAEAKPAKLAMLLDCCHSEFFVEQALIGQGLSGFGDRGYFLSAACRSYERAWANLHENHSVYTGALLHILRDRQAQEVTASEAHNSVQRQLKGSGQEPISFGYGDSLALVTYPHEVTTGVSEECPYQGLNAFTPETETFFKGREDEKALLRQKLNSSNFLPVLGPSGIGKSSVVRAGLITHLPKRDWCVVKMKPGSAPAAELARQMRTLWSELGLSTGEQRDLARVLEVEGLLAVAEKMPKGKRVLLMVDQFEEVFTQYPEGKETERDRFIQDLVRVGRAQTPLAIVMTMRSDFVNEWLATGQPPEVMSNDTVCLGPLVGDGLRAAIMEPAQIQGYRFGPGLLELLLADVEREKNCLPLLEFALTELWEKRDKEKRELTAAAYREMGGLTGALNRRAEAVYDGLRPVERDWAERICLQLVRIGREEKDTRQRQPQQRLLEMSDQDEQTRQTIADVISDLVKGRLLVVDSDFSAAAGEEVEKEVVEGVAGQGGSVGYVDLAHEALLEGWARFKAWRQGDRDLRRLVQRLEDDYEKWKAREESENYLLKGGLLVELKEQQSALIELLRENGRPELRSFFVASDEHDKKTVAALKEAVIKAQSQETSRKIKDKLLFSPTKTVEATVEAISLLGKSQTGLNCVIYPAQDALHRASKNIKELLNLEGHDGRITSVAFSPKGDRFASTGEDGTIRLWDLQGNPISKPFPGYSSRIWSVAFSPKGDQIISGSYDKTLRLWDLKGSPIGKPFKGHSGAVSSVAFSPKGDRIISGSYDKTLRLWDLEGNFIGAPFEGHKKEITSVAFSPNGDRVVSGNDDRTLRLWDLEGNPIGQPFVGHSSGVYSVDFNLSGDRIVSGSQDGTLRLWDLEGNPISKPFVGHSGLVWSVAFDPKGDRIISGSDDETLRLWDLKGNLIGEPFVGHSSSIQSVDFNPKGDRIVSGSHNGSIRLWDLSDSSPISKRFIGHSESVLSVAFSPMGDRIVSGSQDGTLRQWNLQGNTIGKPFIGHSESVRSVAFSPKGDRIVSGSADCTLRLWDLRGNTISRPSIGHSDWVSSVAFNREGDQVISGSADGTLRLWNLRGNRNLISVFCARHGDKVFSAGFSPKGDRIVSGGEDGNLRLWDMRGNPIGNPFVGHSGTIYSVVFDHTGDQIISSSKDGTVRRWDLKGNHIGEPFVIYGGAVFSVVLNKEGDRIVSGIEDGTIRLWDLEGNPIGEPLKGHYNCSCVYSVALSSQGGQIVSGSFDTTLRLWRFGSWEEELRHCCNMLMHHPALSLTQTETGRQACEVCEQVWTRQQSAKFAVAQGSALARKGAVDEAISKFNRANELDPALTLDSAARAHQLAEWG